MINTEKFVAHLRVSGRSEKTISKYLMFLNHFFKDIDTPVADISYDNQIVPFLLRYENQNTRNTCKMAMRNYFRYVGRMDLLDIIKGTHIGKKVYLLPNQYDMIKLIESISEKKLMEKVLILFIYSTGLREDECVHVKKCDIDFNNKLVFVKFGKFSNERNVRYVPDVTFELLKKMWSKRRIKSEYAFIRKDGFMLTANDVGYIVRKNWKKLKINKRLTPHLIRKCFVTHSIDQGAREIIISKNAGHSSMSVTLDKYFCIEALVGKISNPYLYPWNEVK